MAFLIDEPDHVISFYEMLQWLSIIFRIKSKIQIMTHEALHDLVPACVSNLSFECSAPATPPA